MKKVMGQIHLYFGLISGLVVFIVSITGCLYVYEEELKGWLYSDRQTTHVPDQGRKKSLSELLVIAQAEAGAEHPIQNIEIPQASDHTYSFRPAQIRDDRALTHFGEIKYQRKIYVDPYTGTVVKNENTKYEFFTLVLRLHRNLLLNRKVGTLVVGTSVFMFVFLLITGMVLWWPKNKLALKKALSFVWKSTTRWKRKNYDLHSVLGFYASFVLLIVALTGLMWSFDWFDNSVQWVVNGGTKTKKPKPFYSDTTRLTTLLPIDKIYADVSRRHPAAQIITLNFPEKQKGTIQASVRSAIHTRYNTQRYQFDQFTGQLLNTLSFEDKKAGEKLRAMNYDIHVGAILGPTGKFLAFFASLISASLPITGFLVWYGRKYKKTAGQKTPAVRSMPVQSSVRREVFSKPSAKSG